MSVSIMSKVWEMPHLNTGERLLLLAIADHCNDEGVCYPSADRLRRKCGWASKSTYTRYIKILQDAGLIKKLPRGDTREGRKTDLITINHSKVQHPELMRHIRAARENNPHKSTISTAPRTIYKNNNLTPHKYTTLYTNHKELPSQGENDQGFNLESECLAIVGELENKEGLK